MKGSLKALLGFGTKHQLLYYFFNLVQVMVDNHDFVMTNYRCIQNLYFLSDLFPRFADWISENTHAKMNNKKWSDTL